MAAVAVMLVRAVLVHGIESVVVAVISVGATAVVSSEVVCSKSEVVCSKSEVVCSKSDVVRSKSLLHRGIKQSIKHLKELFMEKEVEKVDGGRTQSTPGMLSESIR